MEFNTAAIAFDSLVFVLSLVFLPGMLHRCDCLLASNSLLTGCFTLDFGSLTTGVKVSKLCFNYKIKQKSETINQPYKTRSSCTRAHNIY